VECAEFQQLGEDERGREDLLPRKSHNIASGAGVSNARSVSRGCSAASSGVAGNYTALSESLQNMARLVLVSFICRCEQGFC
jgi:hypothetical protein